MGMFSLKIRVYTLIIDELVLLLIQSETFLLIRFRRARSLIKKKIVHWSNLRITQCKFT